MYCKTGIERNDVNRRRFRFGHPFAGGRYDKINNFLFRKTGRRVGMGLCGSSEFRFRFANNFSKGGKYRNFIHIVGGRRIYLGLGSPRSTRRDRRPYCRVDYDKPRNDSRYVEIMDNVVVATVEHGIKSDLFFKGEI
jgi:hypothetical protein